jgi:hypothetical protein
MEKLILLYQTKWFKGSHLEYAAAKRQLKLQNMLAHHMHLLASNYTDTNFVKDWTKALVADAALIVEDETIIWIPKLKEPQDRQNFEFFIV